AAKAGIIMMTQHLAAQVGAYNIRVNCIAPETILTEYNRVRIPPDQQATLAETHPLKRLGTVEDVAQAADSRPFSSTRLEPQPCLNRQLRTISPMHAEPGWRAFSRDAGDRASTYSGGPRPGRCDCRRLRCGDPRALSTA